MKTELPGSFLSVGARTDNAAGGIRELHWHHQAGWAIMTYGHCWITVLDAKGRPSGEEVAEGDLWYFPPGLPHSLQGLGPDAAEFVLTFGNGAASEFNTLPATDWLAHIPLEMVAATFNLDAAVVARFPGDGAAFMPA